jgi:AcrR family transcriptional regulator
VADRLLSTARTLFYQQGINSVGIQRVIEEAGVAKASLYAHYKSKDDLVAAYLAHESAAVRERLQALLADIPDPADRLLAVFRVSTTRMASPEFRGCPFQNAASELTTPDHPARAVLAEHRTFLRTLFLDLVTEMGVSEPVHLAGALLALLDGAASRALAESSAEAPQDAYWGATQLLAAAAPDRAARTRVAGGRPSTRGSAQRSG